MKMIKLNAIGFLINAIGVALGGASLLVLAIKIPSEQAVEAIKNLADKKLSLVTK